MLGQAQIFYSDSATYVRIDRAGDRFDQIMHRFHREFQLKHWDRTIRLWELPPGDRQRCVQFFSDMLGPNGCIVKPWQGEL